MPRCFVYFTRRRPGTPRRATRERHGVARNGSRERPGYCWGFRGEGKARRVRQVIAVQRSPRDGRCHSCLSHFLPSLWPTLSPWRIYYEQKPQFTKLPKVTETGVDQRFASFTVCLVPQRANCFSLSLPTGNLSNYGNRGDARDHMLVRL